MKNKWFAENRISKEVFINVCNKSQSMAQASSELKLHFNTFKRLAIKYNCYSPNKAGKGISKKGNGFPLIDILSGLHPSYQTYKLKNKLIKEGLKENKCDNCGLDEWDNKPLNVELNHIDGDRTNHNFKNLEMLCPNCHSQTPTYRAKNRLFEHC